ncbi:MAG: 4-vinyl reductase [Desulfobacterales bacterium]
MDQAGLSGKDVLEQYMNSASLRGWGKLKITEYDEDAARVVVTLANSAVAEETGRTDRAVCDHLPGSIAGAFYAILERAGHPRKLAGRETNCLANGDDHCRFEVGPTE